MRRTRCAPSLTVQLRLRAGCYTRIEYGRAFSADLARVDELSPEDGGVGECALELDRAITRFEADRGKPVVGGRSHKIEGLADRTTRQARDALGIRRVEVRHHQAVGLQAADRVIHVVAGLCDVQC